MFQCDQLLSSWIDGNDKNDGVKHGLKGWVVKGKNRTKICLFCLTGDGY